LGLLHAARKHSHLGLSPSQPLRQFGDLPVLLPDRLQNCLGVPFFYYVLSHNSSHNSPYSSATSTADSVAPAPESTVPETGAVLKYGAAELLRAHPVTGWSEANTRLTEICPDTLVSPESRT
jgi:hypothetical protein